VKFRNPNGLYLLTAPSGSGKTRALCEYANSHFALCLVCSTQKNGFSKDIEELIKEISALLHIDDPLGNREKVLHCARAILASRYLVFDALQKKFGDSLTPSSWLAAQSNPGQVFQGDIFLRLSKQLCFHMEHESLDQKLTQLLTDSWFFFFLLPSFFFFCFFFSSHPKKEHEKGKNQN